MAIAHRNRLHNRQTRSDAKLRLPGILKWLVAFYVVALPIQLPASSGLRFAPSDVFAGIYALLVIFQILPLSLYKDTWSWPHYFLISIFALSSLTSLITAGELSQWAILNKGVGLLVLLVSYIFLCHASSGWRELRWIARLFVIASAAHTCIALAVFGIHRLTGVVIPLVNRYPSRISGFMPDPNQFASVLVVGVSIALLTLAGGRPLMSNRLSYVVISVLSLGLFLSYSRSAYLGLGLAITVAVCLRPRLILPTVISTLIAGAVLLTALGQRYSSDIDNMVMRQRSIDARTEIFKHAAPMVAEKPVFGIGLGQFSMQEVLGVPVIVHNTPVWFLVEFGILGLLVFVAYYWWYVRRALQSLRLLGMKEQNMVLGLLVSHIAMLAVAMGIEAFYQRHWWLVMALLASAYRLARNGSHFYLPSQAIDDRGSPGALSPQSRAS